MINFKYNNWAKVAGFVAFTIFVFILILPHKLTYIDLLLWIHFVTLLIHQFEEYILPGGFKDFFNDKVWNKNRITKYPLNNKGVLLVNVVWGWSAYCLSAISGEKYIWLALGLAGITILNGIMHTLMFIIHRKYNPGFISGFFLLIPFGIYLLYTLLEETSTIKITTGIFTFIIGTMLIPLSIFITNKKML